MQPIGLAQWHEATIREAAMKAVMSFPGQSNRSGNFTYT